MRKRRCSICALCNNSKASAALLYRLRSRRRSFLDLLDSATPKDRTRAISGGLATDVPDFVRRKDGARCTKSGARLYSSTLDPLCVLVGRRRRPSASFSGTSSIAARRSLRVVQRLASQAVSANCWIFKWRWARERWVSASSAYDCTTALPKQFDDASSCRYPGLSLAERPLSLVEPASSWAHAGRNF